MAAYPAFPQLLGSTMDFADDLTIDRATSGSAHARSYFVAEKLAFSVKHYLNDDDLATLRAFYHDNRGAPVTLTWQLDSANYSCFMAAPKIVPRGKGCDVTVALVEQ